MKSLVVLCSLLLTVITLHAEYYVVKLRDLKFEKKSDEVVKLLNSKKEYNSWQLVKDVALSARTPSIPVSINAYLSPGQEVLEMKNYQRSTILGDTFIAFKLQNKDAFHGYLDLPGNGRKATSVRSYKFQFDPSQHKATDEKAYSAIKQQHYWILSQTSYLGMPWFNQQASGFKTKEDRARNNRIRSSQFSFYTGGRAISDNLALDRELRLMGKDTKATVDVSKIKGITVKEIDWKPLMPKGEVAIDPLAKLIPEDQHALFCPSLSELDKIVNLLEKEGSPLAQSFTVRNPFRTLPQRYKKQMGIDFPAALANLLPIKSVAITGYDPFFPTGTDVALLMETDKPDALFKMLDQAIKIPNKHIAVYGKAVVLTNSGEQMKRISKVFGDQVKSLGSLDEFQFFRHRYPVTDDATGFVFLSDACIRRWGGPHMRIAAARRTKSIAALNNLTARQISFSRSGSLLVDNENLNDAYKFLLGKVTTDRGQVISSKMGNLQWITPTIEMDLSKVTKAEAAAYAEWRRGYEDGWSKVFDPIGFSFKIDDKTKELDLTVMPLSMDNEYQQLISLVGKSVLSRQARMASDKNIATLSMALDKDGELFANWNRTLSSVVPNLKIKPLAWLGKSITLFAEKDAYWAKLGNADFDFDELLNGAPMGFRVEHVSKLKLALFLTALKTAVEASAPDLVTWETKKHGDLKYVVISSNEEDGFLEDFKICYGITKSAIIFTLREDVLEHALDRETGERKLALNPLQQQADHFYINADSRLLMGLTSTSGITLAERRRQQSYRAIPLLNEYKKKILLLRKGQPVPVHNRLFGEDIYCPGGKGYRWNNEDMTMESVVFGHPANPKKAEDDSSLITPFGHIESAFKFEHDGLRVKLKLKKAEPLKLTPTTSIINPGTELLGILDYPTNPGVRWEYDVIFKESDGKEFKATTWSQNVSYKNDRLLQKQNTFLLEDGKFEEYTGEWSMLIPKGISLLQLSCKKLHPRENAKAEDIKISYSQPLLMFPEELRKGYKMKSTPSFFHTTHSEQPFSHSVEVLKKEDVVIDGKTFKGCAVVQITYYTLSVGEDSKVVIKYWVKPGIGSVKYSSKTKFYKSAATLKNFKSK